MIGGGHMLCGERRADGGLGPLAAAVTAENDAGIDKGADECKTMK